MIHILDGQTDLLLAYLDGQGDGIFIQDEIEQDINGLSTLTFTTLSSSDAAVHLRDLNRVLVPHDRHGWQEFVIYETLIDNDFITVYCIGSETQLNVRKVIDPAKHNGFTLKQYVNLATSGTEWTAGNIEFAGTHTLEFTDYMRPYDLLKSAERAFGMELSFRIEIAGSSVVGRYVDVYEKVGSGYVGKEFVNAKDLIGVQKKIHNDRIITALEAIGPKPQDGEALRIFVSDEEAFQRWNYLGLHIVDIYSPESDSEDMTLTQLETYAKTALKQRIDSVVEYTIETIDLSALIGHEATYLGDSVRIVDTDFNPPLYAEARIINVKRPIPREHDELVEKTYTIGEVVEYTEDDILAKFRDMQAAYGLRVIKSELPPVGNVNIIWIKIDPSSTFEVAHSWDGSKWVPMTPTQPSDIGAETPGGARSKAIETYINVIETEKAQTVSKYDSIYLSPDLAAGPVKTALATAKTNYDTGFNALLAQINAAKADGSTSLAEKAEVDIAYAGYSQKVALMAEAMEDATREIEEEKMLRSRFFTWIKYADSPTTGMSDVPTGKTYLGIAYNKESASESSVYSDYSWSLIAGAKGNEGIPGPTGPGGESLYTWIKYADDALGGGLTDTPTGKKYLGVAYNKTSISESSTAADYSWSLIQGPQGVVGPPGDDGLTTYTWIKYADTPTTGMTETPTNKKYMGIAANKTTASESAVYADYTWSLIVGAKGDTGIQGDPGPDGAPTYMWIKYADTPTTGMADVPTGKMYLGIAYNKSTAAESATYSDYSWSKIEGPQGIDGPQGEVGPRGLEGLPGDDGAQGIPGDPGENGLTSYTHIAYANNVTGTSGFSTTVATDKTYIGMYTDFVAADSTNAALYNWSLIKGADGAEGIPGQPGENGLTSYLHIAYATSANGSVGFSTTVSAGKTYIGQYTDFVAADSASYTAYTWTLIKGETGETGAPGKGVTSIVEQYYLSTSATTQVGGAWSTTVPAWVDGRYMWTRSVITYTDTTSTTSTPVNVTGSKGTTGGTGTPGVGISAVDVMYYLSTSATSLVGGSWVTTAPAWVDGKYMWSKTVTTYTNGTSNESAPANITGAKGPTGGTGAPGKGVTSIVEEYYYSTSATTQTGGAWSTVVPTWVDGKFMWTRAKTTFTDASTSYTSPVNVTGQKGTDGVTTYTWVKYADDVNGAGIADTPDGKRYMGIAVNKTTATESGTAGDYNWSPLYDNVVVGGRNLFEGSKDLVVFSGTGTNNEHGYYASIQHALDKLALNEEMTISIDVDMTKAGTLMIYDSNGDGEFVFSPAKTFSVVAGKQRLSLTARKVANTGTIGRPGDTMIELYSTYGTGNWWTASKLKIERGNVATDWTEAPEDITKYVDDISIGGRNYLSRLGGGRYDATSIYATDETLTEQKTISGKVWLRFKAVGSFRLYSVPIEPNTEYTYSLDVFHETASVSLVLSPYYAGTYGVMSLPTVTTTPKRVSGTFVSKPDATYDILHFSGLSIGTHIADLKLEKGNKSSDWTPSPEDVAADTEAARQAADAASGLATGAQTTADGKSTVFYSTAAPSTVGRKAGDIWFDTDDGNKMYGYNGGWVLEQFGVNAIADLAITNAKIENGAITNLKVSNLDAGKITTGILAAERVQIGAGTTFADGFNPRVASAGATTKIFNNLTGINGQSAASSTVIIRTPLTYGNYMTRVDLTGYVYTGGKETIDASIGFYITSSGTFANTGYSTQGKTAVESVQLATDAANKVVIIIKFVGTSLQYPKLHVEKVHISHVNPPDSFADGWTIEFSTDLTGLTVKNTPPGTDYDKSHGLTMLWQYADTVYIDGGDIYANTVTANQINVGTLHALSANLGTVTAGILRNVSGTNIIDMTAGTISLGSGNFTVSGSTVTFKGALSAATGTFAGALSSATGTFSGSLSAATGTFSGSLSAATGTFSGKVTVAGNSIYGGTNTLTIENGSVLGKHTTSTSVTDTNMGDGDFSVKNTSTSLATNPYGRASFGEDGTKMWSGSTTIAETFVMFGTQTTNSQIKGLVLADLGIILSSAGGVSIESSGDVLEFKYPSGGHAYMEWTDGSTRSAYLGYGSDGSNQFTLNIDKAAGFFYLAGASGMKVHIDALADGHTRIRGSNGPIIKFLKTLEALQFRNYADTGYAAISSSGHTTVSQRELKKNIVSYEGDALHEIVTTPIREYHYNDDLDWEQKRLGVIVDESPLDILDLTGAGVSEYAMVAMAWKAIQQLSNKNDALIARLEELEAK